MNNFTYREQFKVRHGESDMYGKLKLRSFFDYLQEVAANHAEIIGFGYKAMDDAGLLWVLSKMRIKFSAPVHFGDILEITTYPSRIERIFFRREFEIKNLTTGQIAACASSYWLALDKEKLRPVKSERLPTPMIINPDLPLYADFCEIENANFQYANLLNYQVEYTAIDINRHLNNAEYAGIAQNALYKMLPENKLPQELSIVFNSAQKITECFMVKGGISGNAFDIKGEKSDGKSVFNFSGTF